MISAQAQATTDSAARPYSAPPEREGTLTEIITDGGSITMLLPLLARLSYNDRWFTWVAPPDDLPRALLQECGVNLQRLLLARPSAQHTAFTLAKQALATGTSDVVISWNGPISPFERKQLEHAACAGQSHAILLRSR